MLFQTPNRHHTSQVRKDDKRQLIKKDEEDSQSEGIHPSFGRSPESGVRTAIVGTGGGQIVRTITPQASGQINLKVDRTRIGRLTKDWKEWKRRPINSTVKWNQLNYINQMFPQRRSAPPKLRRKRPKSIIRSETNEVA
jgi:hypothetical protein